MKCLLFLFATLFVHVGAQDNSTARQWDGCYDETRSLIKIDSPMFLCLHVANGVDWSQEVEFIRLSFRPKADEYSRLHIPNSYQDLKSRAMDRFEDKSLTVGVGVQTSLSFLRLWAQGPNEFPDVSAGDFKIYPHLTAIIDVKDGVVKGITWDDACVFCSGFACDQITYDFNGVLQNKDDAGQPTAGCGYTINECQTKHGGGGTDCDLVLYVVWTGTDVDGRALLSSANRFSAFPAQELRNRLSQNLPGAVKDAGNPDGNDGAATRDL